MSITERQAEELLSANYGSHWAFDDEEWWSDMVDWLMTFRSVKHLRRERPQWKVPPWWPGTVRSEDRRAGQRVHLATKVEQ